MYYIELHCIVVYYMVLGCMITYIVVLLSVEHRIVLWCLVLGASASCRSCDMVCCCNMV